MKIILKEVYMVTAFTGLFSKNSNDRDRNEEIVHILIEAKRHCILLVRFMGIFNLVNLIL